MHWFLAIVAYPKLYLEGAEPISDASPKETASDDTPTRLRPYINNIDSIPSPEEKGTTSSTILIDDNLDEVISLANSKYIEEGLKLKKTRILESRAKDPGAFERNYSGKSAGSSEFKGKYVNLVMGVLEIGSSRLRSIAGKKEAIRKSFDTSPRIIILDSYASRHPSTVTHLNNYLYHEAMDKEKLMPKFRRIPGVHAKVPEQPNHCDCGIYMLHYLETFLSKPQFFMDLIVVGGVVIMFSCNF